eukprot:TRINITY_DN3354_c0_g1_i1.p1 TRINITY_DN3354_c0_g1~~TRINITY_DN3354_c0_g1_i1.p1  ORF type:complete len:431 (-),score=73.94 TRINITY_DN3354_c0_g1_i1:155-1447(-)
MAAAKAAKAQVNLTLTISDLSGLINEPDGVQMRTQWKRGHLKGETKWAPVTAGTVRWDEKFLMENVSLPRTNDDAKGRKFLEFSFFKKEDPNMPIGQMKVEVHYEGDRKKRAALSFALPGKDGQPGDKLRLTIVMQLKEVKNGAASRSASQPLSDNDEATLPRSASIPYAREEVASPPESPRQMPAAYAPPPAAVPPSPQTLASAPAPQTSFADPPVQAPPPTRRAAGSRSTTPAATPWESYENDAPLPSPTPVVPSHFPAAAPPLRRGPSFRENSFSSAREPSWASRMEPVNLATAAPAPAPVPRRTNSGRFSNGGAPYEGEGVAVEHLKTSFLEVHSKLQERESNLATKKQEVREVRTAYENLRTDYDHLKNELHETEMRYYSVKEDLRREKEMNTKLMGLKEKLQRFDRDGVPQEKDGCTIDNCTVM